MKKSIITILLLFSAVSFAQTKEITKLLNKQFEKEQKMYDEYEPDKPTLVQPFRIKNDTLSVEFSYLIDNKDEHTRHYHRTVRLKDIKELVKDMNVLFMAEDGSVEETVIKKDAEGTILEIKIHHSDMFFTELRKDQKDEFLQKKILKAFEKTGYKITSEHWYH